MSEERNAYHKSWRHKKYSQDPDYIHKKALKELYKTTKEWYDAKLSEQNGHCALCPAIAQSEGGKRLSVDHNHCCCPTKHACGNCNRGLLCFNCNKRLGFLEQTLSEAVVYAKVPPIASWTSRALQYLKRYAK